MLGKSSIKLLNQQTPEDRAYILKLIAHQKLGAKWVYYRKIKRGDKGFSLLGGKSIMEQMKATRAALRFTTRNARKLYRFVYLESIKEIKAYTGSKKEFPEIPEAGDGEEVLSLNSEHDALIISWTPIKFLLPIVQLRAKGMATQRHTEGLAAKLFFKVAGYYADPSSWDRYKLNLYLRKLTPDSPYKDIVSELEPLKSDLDKLVEAYEPFKFGKASLSKDVTADTDAFDDAMGVESFEAQLNTLNWYHFIYHAMELFLFRYYYTLVLSTPSLDAIRYLTTIFGPVLQKAIENRSVFLGSFETDRTKRSFRVPYQKLLEGRRQEPLKKNIKTQAGIFETFTYNLKMLDEFTINCDLEAVPELESEWGKGIWNYVLNIDRPPLFGDNEEKTDRQELAAKEYKESSEFKEEKKQLFDGKSRIDKLKKPLSDEKAALMQREKDEILDDDQKKEIEAQFVRITGEEAKLEKESQALIEKAKALEEKQKNAVPSESDEDEEPDPRFVDTEKILSFEEELSQLSVREFAFINIMNAMINCSQYNRLARFKILERFKERAKNDHELEEKRIQEIQKKAEKKLRELKKRKSKLERMKQFEALTVLSKDIEGFESGIDERIDIIKKDSKQQLRLQKERLNTLFQEIAKEKTVNLGSTPRMLWKFIQFHKPEGEFCKDLPDFISKSIQSNYSKDLEPFYLNIFNIFDLPVKDKLMIIQSLEKTGGDKPVKLLLNEGEEQQLQAEIQSKKNDIQTQMPDLFICKLVFQTQMIPVDDLLKLSLDNKSLNTLLLLKAASPKTTQNLTLKAEIIKAVLELNGLINPLPRNRIMQSGKEKDKNPEKRINAAILTNLLEELNRQ
jgi:hypothetical protein